MASYFSQHHLATAQFKSLRQARLLTMTCPLLLPQLSGFLTLQLLSEDACHISKKLVPVNLSQAEQKAYSAS